MRILCNSILNLPCLRSTGSSASARQLSPRSVRLRSSSRSSNSNSRTLAMESRHPSSTGMTVSYNRLQSSREVPITCSPRNSTTPVRVPVTKRRSTPLKRSSSILACLAPLSCTETISLRASLRIPMKMYLKVRTAD